MTAPAPDTEAAPYAPPSNLRWVGWIGWIALALQLLWLCGFSVFEVHRYALTRDFAAYHQAWYLISRGDLNPFDTVQGFAFWRNNGEFLLWPLALIALVSSHSVVLLWTQDLATVGAEAVAFGWVLDLVRRPNWPARFRPELAVGAATVFLIANPWTYWADAFDFHLESLDILLVMLAGRALERGRYRRCAVWTGLALLGGNVGATLVVGLGLAAILAGPRWRRPGAIVAAAGAGWVVMLSLLGMRGGNVLSAYGYLAGGTAAAAPSSLAQLATGVLEHPLRVVSALWARRFNILSNVAPAGLVGLLAAWGLGVPVLVLLSSNLVAGLNFSQDPAQNLPVYMPIVVGTVMVVGRLGHGGPRRRACAIALTLFLVADTLGWAAVWLPRTSSQWVHVSASAAQALGVAERLIPPEAEVIASQGIVGNFSGRRDVYGLNKTGQVVPTQTSPLYFVLTPHVGIETVSVNGQLATLAAVASEPGVRLVLDEHGVWVFSWRPPRRQRTVVLPAAAATVPAWATPGPAGTVVATGPVRTWHATANGRTGYVVDGDSWRERIGTYRAEVTLAAAVPVHVDVWNSTAGILLSRRVLPPTDGRVTVSMSVSVQRIVAAKMFTGFGPFRITPTPSPPGNDLEVRVWSSGSGSVNVYSMTLRSTIPGRSS